MKNITRKPGWSQQASYEFVGNYASLHAIAEKMDGFVKLATRKVLPAEK